jgi:translation initiation factor 3 subunit B
MAPAFDKLREEDLDEDEFDEDEVDVSDLREKFQVQLEQGFDTFVVIDGLPEVTEDQKPKLVRFLLKKLKTVGKTSEENIEMPMGPDGKSLRYEEICCPAVAHLTHFTDSHL